MKAGTKARIMVMVKAAVALAVKKSSYDVEAYAARICPVDTGALRASIRAVAEGLKITLSAGKFYAKFVEFGTRYMRAQPFLRPAIYRWATDFFPKRLAESLTEVAYAMRQLS